LSAQRSQLQSYSNYIAGDWVQSLSGECYSTVNPANKDEMIGYFPKSDSSDVKAAIEAAAKAFDSWSDTPAPKRGALLFNVWNLMNQSAEEIARIMTREEGKTIRDSRGEVKASLNMLEYFAGEGRRFLGETVPSELSNYFTYTIRKPLGVVAVITPWNFPLSEPVRKVAGALIAGNTVVIKPASSTPLTAVSFVKLLEKSGIPKGVVNLVIGAGSTVGDELVKNELVRGISFTGSTEVGFQLYEIAARRGKKVQAEMGGKNAVIVLPDADLDLAIEGIVQGAFSSTGQRCTCTSRLIVQEQVKSQVIDALIKRTSQLKVGNGEREDVDLGPLANEEQLRKVKHYIEIGKREGANLLFGGDSPKGKDYEKGYFVEPTIFDGVVPEMTIAQEEIFGPVLSIFSARDFDEAIHIANGVRFGLTASIYSQDISNCLKFVNKVEVGMVHVNNPTLGGEAQLPFGGIKASGIGPHELGIEAIDFFSEKITVFVDYTGRKREARFI
jgi:acyl-CoA reductase-like NAD-dependent aldehyde dehydrogenase